MKKRIPARLIPVITSAAFIFSAYHSGCITEAGSAALPAAVTAGGQTAEDPEVKPENPYNYQDDREVPYDGRKWIQPREWNSPIIRPGDYKGGIMLYFDKIGLEPEDSRGKVQRVYFSLTGATEPVSHIKFHFFYDTRLTVVENSAGEVLTKGKALKEFTTGSAMAEEGQLVFYAYSPDDKMLDAGSIFTVDFLVPENAEPGDVYPFGLSYVADNVAADTFIGSQQDDAGRLQMTYVFTKGIYSGYIRMNGEKKPKIYTGDVNGDGVVDSADASEVLLIYAGASTGGGDVPADIKDAADINGDGLVDSADASLILEYYAYVSTGGTDTPDEYFKNSGNQ